MEFLTCYLLGQQMERFSIILIKITIYKEYFTLTFYNFEKIESPNLG